MREIKKFIESCTVPNTTKVIKHVLGNVEDEIERFTLSELEKFILSKKPACPKEITTICYVLGVYGKWLMDHDLKAEEFCKNVEALDKKALWTKAKPMSKKKYLSYEGYTKTLEDIAAYEQYNPLYYQTLLRCIYEGVYNDDMSVLTNLRASDVCGNTITLHEDDGHSYKIHVSDTLAYNLQDLANKSVWERPNRNGLCKVQMQGLYPDSVFKVEKRSSESDKSYKFAYYAKLRKISQDYFGRSVLPLQIYVSGMMHRIKLELNKHGFTLEEAFSHNCRSKTIHEIISKEIIRCNYETGVSNFREMVKGHLESF